MNLFRKLFGKREQQSISNDPGITVEAFFATPFVQDVLSKYRGTTTLLKPHRSANAVSADQSKFGGIPNYVGFEEYPCCDSCSTPLNFVLQLYKRDFPECYFPGHSDLFQLFRCPNYDCPGIDAERSDLKMFHYYFTAGDVTSQHLVKPVHQLADAEAEVYECVLQPQQQDDYPNFDDFADDEFYQIQKQFGDKLADTFMERYSAIQRTKLNGYPSFTQGPYYPQCSCGNTKTFFFQLASEDPEDGASNPPAPNQWSAHGIMMGDVGNIYYFVCKSCGVDSIESYWDCY
jgi:uncharacterized protein YwqG